uniref:NADH dehydrogenase subunit 6 n=1 Tax=Trichuris sp. GHL-2013 TaxID=1305677 RepID=S4U0Y2_9BILA|nr:NADH dehydrogenase subunit 6 [Trichuris sp. GHL-2013]
MLKMLGLLVCTWFLYMVHPLWLSLMVFLMSMFASLFKFFQVHEFGMFCYLFVMVYSGGLLLLLVYMSALVPNLNLNSNFISSLLIFVSILSCSMYMAKENFTYSQSMMFSFQNFLGMSYFVTHKELMHGLIWILLLSFSLISLLLYLLKYPLRSL